MAGKQREMQHIREEISTLSTIKEILVDVEIALKGFREQLTCYKKE